MAVTEEQLNALVQFYKKGKAKYGIGLAGPDEEFVPESDLVSATPTGLLTPIEEIDHRPTTTHDRLSSQQAIRLPASPAPEPVPWRPEMEDPEFTDFVLGLRTRPFDYISSMASAKKTLPITRGMEFDMELLTLRSYPRKHDTPHFFALNREGKMAVESLGQDFPPALSDSKFSRPWQLEELLC